MGIMRQVGLLLRAIVYLAWTLPLIVLAAGLGIALYAAEAFHKCVVLVMNFMITHTGHTVVLLILLTAAWAERFVPGSNTVGSCIIIAVNLLAWRFARWANQSKAVATLTVIGSSYAMEQISPGIHEGALLELTLILMWCIGALLIALFALKHLSNRC